MEADVAVKDNIMKLTHQEAQAVLLKLSHQEAQVVLLLLSKSPDPKSKSYTSRMNM